METFGDVLYTPFTQVGPPPQPLFYCIITCVSVCLYTHEKEKRGIYKGEKKLIVGIFWWVAVMRLIYTVVMAEFTTQNTGILCTETD